MVTRVLTFLIVLPALQMGAATYYIDFAAANDSANGTSTSTPWKRAPGMVGFAGTYVHSVGDVFIFKGGVTWTTAVFPWTIANSGSAGNLDTYTTDHTWFTGGAWSQPVFDAEGDAPTGGMINATTKSYLMFNDLKIVNMGVAEVGNSYNALDFDSCHNLWIQNCTLQTESQRGLYIHFNNAGSYTNFVIASNAVSKCASLIWFASGAVNTTNRGFILRDNTLFDGGSQLVSDVHSDGLVHFFSTPNNVVNQPIIDFEISGNRVYGDWTKRDGSTAGITAFIYNEAWANGRIFNNAFNVDNQTSGQVPVWVSMGSAVGTTTLIANNSINSTIGGGIGFETATTTGSTTTFKNNIVNGTQYVMSVVATAGTLTSDYNLWNSSSGEIYYEGSSFMDQGEWQAAGRDLNGIFADNPDFVSASDLRLQAVSPALGTGENLSAFFTTDLNGDIRSVPWDMGAYKFGSSGGIWNVTTLNPTTLNIGTQ